MAHATPLVEGATLTDRAVVEQLIIVDTQAWYGWLAQATSFAYRDASGRFTARKERRGSADGYWRAYRKQAGKVYSAYLGQSADLSLLRLQETAAALTRSCDDPGRSVQRAPAPPDLQPVATNLLFDLAPRLLPARSLHNLPLPPTPLVGREREVADVTAALQRDYIRLLTLTGPGGVGKTRLGLRLADALRDVFADGVFLVDLAAVHDPDFVVSAIAQVLGVITEDAQPLQQRLTAYIAPKQLLLLLDNFEQVLPAAVSLAALLSAAPGLKLLITSRAPLHLAGEHVFPVAPLALPEGEQLPTPDELHRYSAITVFIQRAQAVRPNFPITTETVPAIIAICRRLDGLPLAIELAAARANLFTPHVLLQRLERRLPLLTNGANDLPARQRTLRDMIDWSYQLLDEAAQAVLQRLAVFAGGCTLEAAEEVCELRVRSIDIGGAQRADRRLDAQQSMLDVITALVDQSLLRLVAEGDGSPRFMMLETVHEYALERLEHSGEAPLLRRRHAVYYLGRAEQVERTLRGPMVHTELDQLSLEHGNIRSALTWALAQGEGELAARLASALLVFWDARPHRREGRDWLESALTYGAQIAPEVRVRALRAAGHLARALYDRDAALARLEQSMVIAHELGDERAYTAAQTDIGWTLALLGGDTQQAAAILHEGLARYRSLGDLHGTAWALQALGWIEQAQALGYPQGIPSPLAGLSWVARRRGSLATARALHAESLALRRKTGDVYEIGWSLASLGITAAAEGEYDMARSYQEERLEIERSLNNNHGVCGALQQLGVIALRQGQLAVARTQLEASLATARVIGDTSISAFALIALGELALAEGDGVQAATRLDDALARFSIRNDNQRIARVCALRAQVALEGGDDEAALRLAGRCIELARAVGDPALLGAGLAYLGDGAARRDEAGWAARLWGAAESIVLKQLRIPAEPADRQRRIAGARAALGPPAFAAEWAVGQGLDPESALASRGAGASRRPTRAAELTRREISVLRLLADGLTNTEIAERLVISLGTVKTYISTIYTKLDVTSRTAAMRYVIDHQL